MSDGMLIPVNGLKALVVDHLTTKDIFVKFEEVCNDISNVFIVTVFSTDDEDSDSEERYYVLTTQGIVEV